MTNYQGILFSSASETAGPLVGSGFETRAEANVHAKTVCIAQPGLECELVSRDLR